MKKSAFEQLAPFIQDYIYRNRWTELRDIQVAACDIIFNTDANLLLTSGTASGKTEAAFLPIITKIYQDPPKTVGVLYISPLKALINDQFERLTDLLVEAEIPVCKWHGDVNQNHKDKLRKKPAGILQITPESLEAMLTYRKNEAILLFADLRFIVIDEVHYFIGENRGIQLQSILERIERLSGAHPRRVGLSATVGNIQEVEAWLSQGTTRECITPTYQMPLRKVHLAIDAATHEVEFYDKLYQNTLGKRCIVFSNAREEVELNIGHLKQISKRQGTKDVYLVHHGNVSGGLREYTEEVMKTSDQKIVTGATVTLELGIDVGELERIVETGAPYSVSSFVQRLGRSGRKTNISEMMFLFNKKDQDDTEQKGKDFYQQIDWDLILTISIVELYMKDHFVEPLTSDQLPFAVLYHQTMCYVTSRGSISPQELAQYMLTLSPFKKVSQEDFRKLLHYLIEKDQLEVDEGGNLMIGLKGERTVNRYQFLTVFENEIEYSVRFESQEVGTVSTIVPVGETLILAGNSWKVVDVNEEKRQIFVKKISGLAKSYWIGPSTSAIHSRLIQKMKEVLLSKEEYSYLREDASKLLDKSRQIFLHAGLDQEVVIRLSNQKYAIFPWLGTKSFVTLQYALKHYGIQTSSYSSYQVPIFLEVKNISSKTEIENILKRVITEPLSKEELSVEGAMIEEKNNQFVPKELLEKHFLEDFIQIDTMKKELSDLTSST